MHPRFYSPSLVLGLCFSNSSPFFCIINCFPLYCIFPLAYKYALVSPPKNCINNKTTTKETLFWFPFLPLTTISTILFLYKANIPKLFIFTFFNSFLLILFWTYYQSCFHTHHIIKITLVIIDCQMVKWSILSLYSPWLENDTDFLPWTPSSSGCLYISFIWVSSHLTGLSSVSSRFSLINLTSMQEQKELSSGWSNQTSRPGPMVLLFPLPVIRFS